MYYLIITLIIVLLILFAIWPGIEPFYYYPPSNCMQNIFGNTTCYPPGYYPFYSPNYLWPFYPYWYSPYYYKSPYWPLEKKKIIVKRK